jgi:MFS family permease
MSIAKKTAGTFEFYYGWIIVAVALISMAGWFGIRTSFSVFYVALLEDFPWNRGDSAAVQSMAMITYTIMAPIVGGLIDRFSPRRVIVPGILVLCLGLVLCATIKNLNQFYLYYGIIVGVGVTSIGIISYSAIISHWFENKRGLKAALAWRVRLGHGWRAPSLIDPRAIKQPLCLLSSYFFYPSALSGSLPRGNTDQPEINED